MKQAIFLNPAQQILALLNQRPLLCHNTPVFCLGCEPGQIFQCAQCNRLVPWCMGASDKYEDICDRCVAIQHQQNLIAG